MNQKRPFDIQAYRETAEWLERVRIREAAALTEEDALRQIKSLVAAGPVWRENPEWSGLVEQQEIFARARKKARKDP